MRTRNAFSDKNESGFQVIVDQRIGDIFVIASQNVNTPSLAFESSRVFCIRLWLGTTQTDLTSIDLERRLRRSQWVTS